MQKFLDPSCAQECLVALLLVVRGVSSLPESSLRNLYLLQVKIIRYQSVFAMIFWFAKDM